MPLAAAIAGSAIIGAVGSNKAAKAQGRAADQQFGLQREIYDDTSAKFKPFLDQGRGALDAYSYELGMGAKPKDYAGFQKTPGYQFQFDQGTDAVNAMAASRGGLVSGRTMQDLTKFGQGLANQEYGNHLNRLAGMTDMGAGAAANQASAGNAFAAQGSAALGAKGNAQAAGWAGMAGTAQGAIGQGVGAWQYQRGLNALPKYGV